jgi:hypothetical protein
MRMPNTSEEKIQAAETDKKLADSAKIDFRLDFLLGTAGLVFSFGLIATVSVYTMSPYFALPNISGLIAELLPNQKAQAPIPEAVIAALKDIQSAQQQQAEALQESASLLQLNTVLLQQNTVLRQQDQATFDSLRKSITDDQVDVKKISSQFSMLIAKIDSLQTAITTEITSSIPKGRTRERLSGAARKSMARQAKPVGPVSVGGAPLATAPESIQNQKVEVVTPPSSSWFIE